MKDIQYLNISALVYIDFIDGDKSNSLSKCGHLYQLKYTRNVGCILVD